jgi:hypothetical protein
LAEAIFHIKKGEKIPLSHERVERLEKIKMGVKTNILKEELVIEY